MSGACGGPAGHRISLPRSNHDAALYELSLVARNGPNWEPKIFVDVIVEIRRFPDNSRLYSKDENAYIYRVD